jgi:NAD-dependent dihydropyrimidine dehydrogenase PreA subunit
MAYVITDACMDRMDRSCIDECPVDCIKVGEQMLYINPDDCVDCGACEPVCPVDAIYYETELPKDKKQFVQINRDFFKQK